MHWNLVMLALLPLFSGYCVIRGMLFYSGKEYSARNVSPSFFAAIALLFALFASLIFGEVWNRVANINTRMLTQASSLRGILRISENLPKAAQPFREAVDRYIKGIENFESDLPSHPEQPKEEQERDAFSNTTFQPLYRLATDSTLFNDNSVLQQEVLRLTDELRNAWFERKELLKQRVLPEKVLILFLMGFFTQLSIAFSHLGNEKAIRDTVWLFSLVFFASLAILLSIDDTALSRHFISLSVLRDVY